MSRRTAWIIGGGLAGATCARQLMDRGFDVTVFEREPQIGGLVRSDMLDGVVYEPHGSHIFHTDDHEVARLASRMTTMRTYHHSVLTMVEGKMLTWPLQADELMDQLGLDVPHNDVTPHENEDFESFCIRLMGRTAYSYFVKDYTEKQWGRPPHTLSAAFAPKRVQVRTDGDKRLFKDDYQMFPDASKGGSYADMLDNLVDGAHIVTDVDCTLADLVDMIQIPAPRTRKPEFVAVTVPLDVFCANSFGELQWRGLSFTHRLLHQESAQQCMVVNWPGKVFPWIRTHETKHASGQGGSKTVLTTEFTNGPGRYYPVPDKDNAGRVLNAKYMQHVRRELEQVGVNVGLLGRLATYQYLDMDDVMRDAINVANHAVDSTVGR